jgi:hypothetical protein
MFENKWPRIILVLKKKKPTQQRENQAMKMKTVTFYILHSVVGIVTRKNLVVKPEKT